MAEHRRGNRNSSWLVFRRLLTIVRCLMRGPATKGALLAEVRVAGGPEAYSEDGTAATRAFKRDRELLATHFNITVVFDRRDGVYRLANRGDMPWLDLSDEHLAALGMLYETFDREGPESRRVMALLDLIVSLLPEERMAAVQRARRVLSVELTELDDEPIGIRVRDVLQRAIAQRQQLSFNYRAAARLDEELVYHVVEPYQLVFRRGHWYLDSFDLFSRSAAHGETRQETHRPFRVQRITDDDRLQVLPTRLPPGRRPTKHYSLRYYLTPSIVRHGISRHFADMRVAMQDDGSAIVEATTHDTFEAVRTLLAYGEGCIVLGGDEVLRAMRRRVRAMALNYSALRMEDF